MGIPLLLILLHTILITSDISTNIPLRLVILLFVFAALISFIFKRFIYSQSNGYDYRVAEIRGLVNANEIILSSLKKKLNFIPSQFIFIKAVKSKINSELHPFTISGWNEQGEISIIVKQLGDYTNKIGLISNYDLIKIYGPHGRFFKHFKYEKQIWIAGGIGITPFMAKLQELSENIKENNKQITLYYIAREAQDFIYPERIKEYENKIPGFKVIFHDTTILGRIDPKSIIEKDSHYLICASEKLTDSFVKTLRESKIPKKVIHTELFKLY